MPVQRDFSQYFTAVQATAPVQNTTKKVNYTVENLFKPTFKNGTAEVIMRFLPSHPSEFKPFIENRTHMYQFAEGKWFGCDCLEKYGTTCPICDYNHKLYTCGKFTKEEARPLRLPNARRRFIANVLIVKNDNAPDTEGQVYRFEFGVQIMDMIRNAWQGYDDPEEGHVDGFNPFDWKTGANFIYNGVQGAMGPKLDKSRFGKQRPISDKTGREYTAAEIDEIESKLYTLDEYERKLEDSKSYDEIVAYYRQKTGKSLFGVIDGDSPSLDAQPATNFINASKPAVQESVVDAVKSTAAPAAPAASTESEDDFFASLEK